MKKTTTFPVILTLAVVLCFVLVSVEQAEPAGPQWFGPTWPILKEGTAAPVVWQPAENPRFAIYDPGTPEDETDDAVLDKETGLVWERSPDNGTTRNWSSAIRTCYNLEVANRKGFRLPTIEELASLVDTVNVDPALPTDHPFFTVQSDVYWSSTTNAGNAASARVVFFDNGGVGTAAKILNVHVWCVRGGQGHDAY